MFREGTGSVTHVIHSGAGSDTAGNHAVRKAETRLAPAGQRLPKGTGLFPGGEDCITPDLKEIPGTGSTDCHWCFTVSLLSKV